MAAIESEPFAYYPDYVFGVFKDVTVSESHDCNTHGSQVFVPQTVLLNAVVCLVLGAVDLDDQFGSMAIEVSNIIADCFLAVEPVTSQLLCPDL